MPKLVSLETVVYKMLIRIYVLSDSYNRIVNNYSHYMDDKTET